MLIKRFEVSRNLSYDAMLQFLRSDNMTDQGPLDLMETGEHEHGSEIALPGVSRGDFSKRRVAPQINVQSVQFCPTGESAFIILTFQFFWLFFWRGFSSFQFLFCVHCTVQGMELLNLRLVDRQTAIINKKCAQLNTQYKSLIL